MSTNRRGPKTTAEIAARERGILRRPGVILRDENDMPIDGYHPVAREQVLRLQELEHLYLRIGRIPRQPNNVAAAELIRRLERRT